MNHETIFRLVINQIVNHLQKIPGLIQEKLSIRQTTNSVPPNLKECNCENVAKTLA